MIGAWTPFIRMGFSEDKFENVRDCSSLRLTLDEPEDVELLKAIFAHFEPDIYFELNMPQFLNSNPLL